MPFKARVQTVIRMQKRARTLVYKSKTRQNERNFAASGGGELKRRDLQICAFLPPRHQTKKNTRTQSSKMKKNRLYTRTKTLAKKRDCGQTRLQTIKRTRRRKI